MHYYGIKLSDLSINTAKMHYLFQFFFLQVICILDKGGEFQPEKHSTINLVAEKTSAADY